MHALHGIGRATPRAFPAQRRGRSPRNAQSQQNFLFCGYDVTCAAPSPLSVQRRGRACAMPTPALCLMPRQFRSLGHGFTHWAHPTCFLPLAIPTQPCAKRCKIWIREHTRVKCGDLADRNHHANIHRAGGNQIFQNSAAKHRIPNP